MADIDVVPKRRTNVWIWVVAAIVLALIVMAMMGVFSGGSRSRVGQLMNVSPAAQVTPGQAAMV
jgi:hypothetical protein